jgi:ABC-type polysaccharide/polyol phosphate transport system ATPase subunit
MTDTSQLANADSAPVIVVDHVWKRYPRSEYRPSLRHEAVSMLKRMARQEFSAASQPFFAIKDVSFVVQRGEGVGIIGRNGSGKTTLLRLLSRITRPTTGRISVIGRYAALIGLSAGFNPERTGRENIYLNAAIHGVSPRRVNVLMDDIVEFAELGEFIDRPVKLYSSGMVARLGFSAMIHVLPEIIFLDEVLAVGDIAFQEKCLERIFSMKEGGRTVLFVSHSTKMVQKLCERAIWLNRGEVVMDGPSPEVLSRYEEAMLG